MKRQIGEYVTPQMRGMSETAHLEYPYTFAADEDEYFIWHRDTGEIVWVVHKIGIEGFREARDTCWDFNGWGFKGDNKWMIKKS